MAVHASASLAKSWLQGGAQSYAAKLTWTEFDQFYGDIWIYIYGDISIVVVAMVYIHHVFFPWVLNRLVVYLPLSKI